MMTMSPPQLALKNAFNSDRCAVGTWVMFSSAWNARIVASTGWDWIVVDCEHGNIGDSDMHDSVNAIASCGVSPIVRIRGNDPTLIKRALDCGSHGIMVPMVNTAAQARTAVAASRFPPRGERGQGSPFSGMAWGLTTPEYLVQANEGVLVIIQIETLEGVDNVEEICAVPGVDAIFIGPNDLAMSMLGYAPAHYTEEPYLAAIEKVRQAGKVAGVKVGILAPDGVKGRAFRGRFDMVGCGGDVKAMQGWMQKAMRDVLSTEE